MNLGLNEFGVILLLNMLSKVHIFTLLILRGIFWTYSETYFFFYNVKLRHGHYFKVQKYKSPR